MSTEVFRMHGEFCASNPWEVIVTTVTLTACMLFVDRKALPKAHIAQTCVGCESKYAAVDLVVMTFIRCLAVLYSYYHFRKLQKLGSKYVLGIAGLFTVFSSFVFSSAVINVLGVNLYDLKDALFFFLLLIDLSKATALAEFALSASNKEEVKTNIANGIARLGPSITLDTFVEILVIGIGSLTGVRRLEMLSYFACLSVVVNYLVFMTFYPSCLSLILELSRAFGKGNLTTSFITKALDDEDQKSNPVVQQVKLIMAFGLMWVHIRSRWGVGPENAFVEDVITSKEDGLKELFVDWVACSVDHIVILILLAALIFKFVFFEDDREMIIARPLPVEYDRSRRVNHEKSVQTDDLSARELEIPKTPRNLRECVRIYEQTGDVRTLSDPEIVALCENKTIASRNLEMLVGNLERAVTIRRQLVDSSGVLADLPYKNYDYARVAGVCCENVIGYAPVPVGIAGPLSLDGKLVYVPMATTEGCLVASTNRGCRALMTNGVQSRIVSDGMSRGPVCRFPSATRSADVALWLKTPQVYARIRENFDSTSRFARLKSLRTRVAGRYLFLRFVATTGDAMGMNMVSKGTEFALQTLRSDLPDMEILTLSGNYCADKKPSAVNWIEGRGKSVVCESVVPEHVVRSVLKTTTHALVEVNVSKNLVGSAMAGSIGGFNAHASNVVTAVFIATGQDPAQNVTSSNCITLLEAAGEDGRDLRISCTMPSVEVGTVGGGTQLAAQAACLEMLGVKGGAESPGENASRLARIVCGAVLAGELSLLAVLCEGWLVDSHLRLNRSVSGEKAGLG